jgi:hypothetical protein
LFVYLLIILLLLTKAGKQASRQAGRQVGRQQGTFRLATNDRPTVSILSLLPKRKETKGEKTKKRGKEFCKNVVLFLTLLGVESETLIISKR